MGPPEIIWQRVAQWKLPAGAIYSEELQTSGTRCLTGDLQRSAFTTSAMLVMVWNEFANLNQLADIPAACDGVQTPVLMQIDMFTERAKLSIVSSRTSNEHSMARC